MIFPYILRFISQGDGDEGIIQDDGYPINPVQQYLTPALCQTSTDP